MKNSIRRDVLLVDDHAVVRAGLKAIIDGTPDLSVCGEAEDEAQALALLRDQPVEVAVVDLMLGKNSALASIKRFLQYKPDLRILMFSMHDEEVYATRALQAGAHGYLMKGADSESLIVAIRTVASGRIYLSPRVQSEILFNMAAGHPASAAGNVNVLTQAELAILQMLGSGQSVKEISKTLGRSLKTIATHRNNIRLKLELPSSAALVHFATRWVQANEVA
ncbi:DNA-binding response regulator [Novosphingobium sediminis]|uniref:DNA-binding response regulator n=1 Tax=Novosphingobium sediminis TaxID=707214 RepID=A0A512APP0_9SPHN|nr:response regulator transcription factor [Novosphingobium sediminis]GEO01662.1 DNA-binding response regulator [Novosphingobium sediminis]